MLDHRNYVPILKAKAGEFDALASLPADIWGNFTPFIELTPIPLRWPEDVNDDPVPSKSIDDHVEWLVDGINKSCGRGKSLFIDGNYIEEEDLLKDQREPISAILSEVARKSLEPIPVVGIDRTEEYVSACRDFCKSSKSSACIRLTTNDMGSVPELGKQTAELLQFMETTPGETHLLLDYASITPAIAGPLKMAIPLLVNAIPSLGEWKSVTLAASSFPKELSDVGKNSLDTFGRIEWDIWHSMRNDASKLTRLPTFSDYTVTHPDFSLFDPRKMRIGPKIKYTDQLQWLVAKGEAYRSKKEKAKGLVSVPAKTQFPLLAKMIVDHPAWKGRDFSWGDECVDDCAAGKDFSASLQHWVAVATVHHIVFVVRQISNLPAI